MARRCLGRSAGRAEPAPEIGTTGENRRNAPNGLLRRAGETKERRIVGGVRRTTGGWQAVVESSRRFDYDDSSRLPPFLVVQFAGCVPPRLTCAAVYPPSGARRSVSSTSSTSVVSVTSTLFDFCALVRGSTNFWGRFRRRVRAASVQPFFFFFAIQPFGGSHPESVARGVFFLRMNFLPLLDVAASPARPRHDTAQAAGSQ